MRPPHELERARRQWRKLTLPRPDDVVALTDQGVLAVVCGSTDEVENLKRESHNMAAAINGESGQDGFVAGVQGFLLRGSTDVLLFALLQDLSDRVDALRKDIESLRHGE
jgi:hypothetical protein